jgi:uncharacterized membrane protein
MAANQNGEDVLMIVIYIPLLVSLIGVVLYATSNNGKVQTLARDMFWVGLLVFLLHFGGVRV